jgi:hypothetical protein
MGRTPASRLPRASKAPRERSREPHPQEGQLWSEKRREKALSETCERKWSKKEFAHVSATIAVTLFPPELIVTYDPHLLPIELTMGWLSATRGV